jgi:hypothetical protein
MIQRRSNLKRSAPPARRTPVKKKRAAPRRVSVLRCRAYLDWLKERRCVVRDCQPRWVYTRDLVLHDYATIDAAHGPVNGRGSKGPDNEAIPLCRAHHERQHAIGWPAFEKEFGFSRKKEAKVHWAAFQLVKETV